MSDPLKQVADKQRRPSDNGCLGHDSWLADHAPTVLAMLARTKDAEGKSRRTATVTVFCDEQDGRFKAVIKDRESLESLWVTIDDLGAFFESLEDALTSERALWRAARNPAAGRR